MQKKEIYEKDFKYFILYYINKLVYIKLNI